MRGWAVDFQKLILKKYVLIRTREREIDTDKERDRCVKGARWGRRRVCVERQSV